MRIVVYGTGAWGTTLAAVQAAAGRPTTLLARTMDEADQLRLEGENRRHLPGVALPPSLHLAADLTQALREAVACILAVPSQTLRAAVRQLAPALPAGCLIVSASKGLEIGSGQRMSEVIKAELGEAWPVAVLSGPNLAREVAQHLPTASVAAARHEAEARLAQDLLTTSRLRIYTSSDVLGVELGGALKNVIALGAGIGDGLGYGDNAKAAWMTRGLFEMARLGHAMGANPLTFAGLSGLGDLAATCNSRQSRNRTLGERLARGEKLDTIRKNMHAVAEGVPTTVAALALGARYNVELPIAEQMYAVLFSGKDPAAAVAELMRRGRKDELEGIRF